MGNTSTTKTDYIGTYTEYTFDDGHVETDPPNRPIYKEDVQLQRTADTGATEQQLLRPLTVSMFNMARFANTLGINNYAALLTSVPVGGRVVGANAGSRNEYSS